MSAGRTRTPLLSAARSAGLPQMLRVGSPRKSCQCQCPGAGMTPLWSIPTNTRAPARLSRPWPGCAVSTALTCRSLPATQAEVNDGAAALLIASDAAAQANGFKPLARVVGMCAAGVEPRIMGIGPLNASQKVLARTGLCIDQIDVIELNEAFASQALATLRGLGLPDDARHVNPNGGAIAMGHPLGMSGARLVLTAAYQLRRNGGRYALCTMCVGVGQGAAIIIERI